MSTISKFSLKTYDDRCNTLSTIVRVIRRNLKIIKNKESQTIKTHFFFFLKPKFFTHFKLKHQEKQNVTM